MDSLKFKVKEMKLKVKNKIDTVGIYLQAAVQSPTHSQVRSLMFMFGVCLLALGLSFEAMSQNIMGNTGTLTTTYNDDRITNAINAILTYIEGAFGALIMIAAGLMAIVSSAMGQYKAALGLLVVAVGAFILRSLVSTFFNDDNIQG